MLTSRGWGLTGAVAALGTAVALLGYAELAIPAAAGAFALLLGAASVWRRPDVTAALRLSPPRVHRGTAATAHVGLRNQGRRSPTLQVRIGHDGHELSAGVPALGRDEQYEAGVSLPTRRRGIHRIGPVRLHQGDQFGLWRRVSALPHTAVLQVLPAVVPVSLPPAMSSAAADGPTRENSPEGGNTFHALREYVPGDDLRFVHWKASARGTAGLRVRRYVDPVPLTVTVLLDLYRPAFAAPEDAEAAIDLAASILVAATRRGREFRLLTTCAVPVPPATGPGRHLDVLTLARLHDEPRAIQEPAGLVPSAPGRGSGVITVLTGGRDEDQPETISSVAVRYQRAIVVRVDSRRVRETAPAAMPRLTVLHAADLLDAARLWSRAVSVAGRRGAP